MTTDKIKELNTSYTNQLQNLESQISNLTQALQLARTNCDRLRGAIAALADVQNALNPNTDAEASTETKPEAKSEEKLVKKSAARKLASVPQAPAAEASAPTKA